MDDHKRSPYANCTSDELRTMIAQRRADVDDMKAELARRGEPNTIPVVKDDSIVMISRNDPRALGRYAGQRFRIGHITFQVDA